MHIAQIKNKTTLAFSVLSVGSVTSVVNPHYSV
jgi:hypothetical protein